MVDDFAPSTIHHKPNVHPTLTHCLTSPYLMPQNYNSHKVRLRPSTDFNTFQIQSHLLFCIKRTVYGLSSGGSSFMARDSLFQRRVYNICRLPIYEKKSKFKELKYVLTRNIHRTPLKPNH